MAKTIINGSMVVGLETHCEKYVWNLIHKPENLDPVEQSIVISNGYADMLKAARKMFHEKNIVDLDYDDSIPYDVQCIHTYEELEDGKHDYIASPIFAIEGCISRPQYIQNFGNGHIGLFILHMSKEGEFDDEGNPKGKNAVKFAKDIAKLSYHRYVIEKLGYKVDKCTLFYINGTYTKQDRHAWSELFTSLDVTQMVKEHEGVTERSIEHIKELMLLKEEPSCPGFDKDACLGMECPCLKRCQTEAKALDSIVWKISRLYKKDKCMLANNGYVTTEDLLRAHEKEIFIFNDKQHRQLLYARYPNKKPLIDADALEEWWKNTFEGVKTLVFFDFETFQYVVPKFRDLKPYSQMPFQWSAHVLNTETGEIKHVEFLARKGKDPRRACVEKMLTLPHDGNESVRWVAYNMGFEKGVIHSLAELFEGEYDEELMDIRESFVDLMIPFQNHWIYKADFQGSYSIKYILPGLFPYAQGLNYHNLDNVQNGSDAQRAYLEMQFKKGAELEKLKYNMLKYCGLDTWAMVMIFGFLVLLRQNNYSTLNFSEKEVESKFFVA